MNRIPHNFNEQVGLFFVINNEFLYHHCHVNDGEVYGDFINYPFSHDDIWVKHYQNKYAVDFDYYPRGRIIYNKPKNIYVIFYDRCIKHKAIEIKMQFHHHICQIEHDEHYQCHMCHEAYISR